MTHPDPGVEYGRRQAQWTERQARCEARLPRLARARRFVLGLIIAVCILAEKETVATKIFLILTPALVLDGLDRWRRRTEAERERCRRALAFYEARRCLIEGEPRRSGREGTRFLHGEVGLAHDLDLFGAGSLFERLHQMRTEAGEETLARWLTQPATPEEIRSRQAAVAELRPALLLREDLALLEPADAVVTLRGLRTWATASLPGFPLWQRALALILVAFVHSTLIGSIFFETGWQPLALGLMMMGVYATWLRPRVEPMLAELQGRAAELRLLAEVIGSLARGPCTAPLLRQLQTDLRAAVRPLIQLARRASWLKAKNSLPEAPLSSTLLWTTQIAFSVARWRQRWGRNLDMWLDHLGTGETLLSLGGHAYENPDDTFPELTGDGPLFHADGLRHPLLPRGKSVPNDLHLDRATSLFLVSGSNMSGKSTLLRAVGINAVLAQAGATVAARHLSLSPLTVGGTLRVQDSLRAGESRFYAEILRVRRLIDATRATRPVLFLLDELFAGTNAADRQRAAEAILLTLVEAGAVGLVTTHDLALTAFVDHLHPRAVNVHFADRVEGEEMVFDYRLRPGVLPHGNALTILRAAGFDV